MPGEKQYQIPAGGIVEADFRGQYYGIDTHFIGTFLQNLGMVWAVRHVTNVAGVAASFVVVDEYGRIVGR